MRKIHKRTSQSGLNLLVHDNVDLNATLSSSFQQLVETVVLVLSRGSAQVKFRAIDSVNTIRGHTTTSRF